MDKATRILRDMKYARIIELIAVKQHISLEDAMDMLYSSPLFEIIDDGTADLICRSTYISPMRLSALTLPPGNSSQISHFHLTTKRMLSVA